MMNTWRMAMKLGNQGISLWPYFHEKSVAAITYYPVIDYNLSLYSKENRPKTWNELHPSQKGSLDCVAYEMKPGDIIYVKEGKTIVSKGKVLTSYFYDASGDIKDENGEIWPHRVYVKWDDSFPQIELLLGAEQTAVLKLDQERIGVIESKLFDVGWVENVQSMDTGCNELEEIYKEGNRFLVEQYINKRNIALIHRKKIQSDYSCEVCSFKFSEMYGDIGEKYIEAHHKNMITYGERDSTMSDISLLCANCHSMIHRKSPPYTISELKDAINSKRGYSE